MKAIFENSVIREVYITDEVRYIEFNHLGEFRSYFNSFTLLKKEMLYAGEHRTEIKKWIIVLEVNPQEDNND